MDRIGRYEVVERLGAGAFATVYRAEDPILELPVAIKVLADNAAGDPDLRSRFINEARFMRRMNSARIATIYDIAELPDARPYVVMQLARRGTLHDRLREVRGQGLPITVADLLAVVRGLGDALAVVHDAGVVHRDVKPSNVLIDVAPGGGVPDQRGPGTLLRQDEFLLLADFGIAKSLAETRRMTAVAGTAAYMAPEQRVVGVPIDGRADIYAATAVVAELVDGVPIAGGAAAAAAGPGCRAAVGAALGRGMSEDPDGRPADARAWSREFATALAGNDPGPPPVAEPPRGGASPARWLRRVAVGLVAALAIGGMVAAASAWWPAGAGPDIVGPRNLTVGQTGVYYVDPDPDIAGHTWTGPDGGTQRGAELEVTAEVAGSLRIAVATDEGAESAIEVSVADAVDSVGIVAPVRAAVGETIEFRSQVPDGTPIRWVHADGDEPDSTTLTIRVTSPGVLTVRLEAEVDGATRTASHTVTVVP